MKLYFALAAIAGPLAVHAAPTGNCIEQDPCVSFTVTKLSSDACGVGGDCPVEVCMKVNGGNEGCGKGASGTFSHMCMMSSSSNGCPTTKEDGSPLLGGGDSTTCSDSGMWSGTSAFDGKCSDANNVTMCQEGKPGDKLYWQLKDGSDSAIETPKIFTKTFLLDGTDECSVQVECLNNQYNCGSRLNAAQRLAERTWIFTIPEASSCAICDSTPDYAPGAPTDISPVSSPSTPTANGDGTDIPGTRGDPHFKSWSGEHFEYHGQCDLILAKDANFADGLGLDIQIRTKLVRYWSYIKRVAIRIGEDIFELEGDADQTSEKALYWYNFDYQPQVQTIGGFPISFIHGTGRFRKHHVTIDLSSKYPGVKIVFSTYKEFIRVDFEGTTEEAFGNVSGILGNYQGKTLARDGETEIHDFNELGNEWQVKPEDTMLFHDVSDPQFPKACVLPEDPQGQRRRRLAESSVSTEDAEKACASLTDDLDRKECVYDIIATQDLDMAGAY